jgi:rfaE bifunctional protein nucleotidyltransferase chain/domain
MFRSKNGIANKVIREMEGGNTPKISQVSTSNIIWVNGSFDVVHAGHIELFKYARSVGDYLVVGTDTDERIRELKGPTRPINKQIHRLSMLNAIKYIDKVVTFGSLEEQLICMEKSGAKTLVIGSDYKDKPVVGEDRMEVIYFDRVDNLSTTNIVS